MNDVAKIREQDVAPADPMVSMIERVAVDPNSDLAKLERMLDMKERHEANLAKAAFDAAFSQASAEFPEIPLNGKNNHSGQRYATLKDIIGKTRPVLARHGLALSFSTEVDDKNVIVTAELSHKGGYTKRNSLPLPRDTGSGRNAVQAVGSSQTYGQRYTAQAILGLSLGEDTEDDGNTSGKHAEPERRAPSRNPWVDAILQELPDDATDRDKAVALTEAICAQWRRKRTQGEMHNEWDRREKIIDAIQSRHPDLHTTIVENYEARLQAIGDAAAEQERLPV